MEREQGTGRVALMAKESQEKRAAGERAEGDSVCGHVCQREGGARAVRCDSRAQQPFSLHSSTNTKKCSIAKEYQHEKDCYPTQNIFLPYKTIISY